MHSENSLRVYKKDGTGNLQSGFGVRPIRLCFLIFVSVGIGPEAALAQSASFRAVDINSDGVLTLDELTSAFGRNGAKRLLRSTDHNGDGRITISELRRGPFGDRGDDKRPGASNDDDDDRDDDRDDGNDEGDDGGDDD